MNPGGTVSYFFSIHTHKPQFNQGGFLLICFLLMSKKTCYGVSSVFCVHTEEILRSFTGTKNRLFIPTL